LKKTIAEKIDEDIEEQAKNKKAYACPKCGCRVWTNTYSGLELECARCDYRIPDLPDDDRTFLTRLRPLREE
jgi:DNA-directed RNA polymerase subunit RPC12/RpoP